jgi:hypothetical protein
MDDRDVDELHRIWELKEKGAISEDEYARLKAKILENHPDTSGGPAREYQAAASASPIASALPAERTPRNYRKIAGIGCLGFLGLILVAGIIGSNSNQSGNSSDANTLSVNSAGSDTNITEAAEADTSPWSYSQDEDKVRGGTTYYARITSTNSISQSFPYDSDTTMSVTVRKSPAYGTDVVLTISSGQMMCPSYEGCSGTVRFDRGPAQRVSFNGPEDNSTDTIFVVGAKQFISKLKSAKKMTIEKTLYEAGNPQFEFDVHGLKWTH